MYNVMGTTGMMRKIKSGTHITIMLKAELDEFLINHSSLTYAIEQNTQNAEHRARVNLFSNNYTQYA